ncbi:MAG: YicC family protein, partial [Syntrophales bacterium]|nr:YicC family protein [Syntrophales bacterium]
TEESLDPARVWEGLQGVLDAAMTALEEMRVREGESIGSDLLRRVELMSRHMEKIRERAPQVVLEYRKKLSDRIRELAEDIALDENRLSQETAIMADRSDITEEIIRFASHTEQLTGLLKGNEAVGRKIDFLLQEMNREANTVGSKSNDAEISQRVVEVKTELSRLREQVQNIE